jgi:hypothetical protein
VVVIGSEITTQRDAMPKRRRTNHRIEVSMRIATTALSDGLTDSQVDDLIEVDIANNPDLEEEKAKAEARYEYGLLLHVRMRPHLLPLYRAAKKIIDAQPPGGKLRLNHLMMAKARLALNHPKGVAAALREMRT